MEKSSMGGKHPTRGPPMDPRLETAVTKKRTGDGQSSDEFHPP